MIVTQLEVEKALSGVGSDGDSGVATRAFGTFLTWLSDTKSPDAFVVMTSNDISKLPPEFSRAERLDAIFFLDLPNNFERAIIWTMYEEKYGVKAGKFNPEGWTGAEIQSCCRLAASLGVSVKEASEYVVPVSVTAGEKITALREWAKGRAVSATEQGVYTGEKSVPVADLPRRKITSKKVVEEGTE